MSRPTIFCNFLNPYVDPYRRTFELRLSCYHFNLIVWRWQFTLNLHGVGPDPDHVVDHFKRVIARAQKEAEEQRRRANELSNRLLHPKQYYQYE